MKLNEIKEGYAKELFRKIFSDDTKFDAHSQYDEIHFSDGSYERWALKMTDLAKEESGRHLRVISLYDHSENKRLGYLEAKPNKVHMLDKYLQKEKPNEADWTTVETNNQKMFSSYTTIDGIFLFKLTAEEWQGQVYLYAVFEKDLK